MALMDLPIKKKCVMKTEAYFADTNAFLYLLEKKPFILPFTDAPWHFSVITEVELLGWHKISRREAGIILEALSFCVRHPVTDAVLEQAISIKQAQKLKTTDALIAATAITLQMPVLTANKEFAPIKGLDIILIELYLFISLLIQGIDITIYRFYKYFWFDMIL